MSDNALPSFWVIMGDTLVIVMSISVLFLLFVIIPSGCAGIIEATAGKAICRLESGAYLFGAVFVMIVFYAGFNLFSMLFPTKKESCRICSLLIKR
jgi:hypothetical protein